jgi:Domain of unknown function (DUF5666)
MFPNPLAMSIICKGKTVMRLLNLTHPLGTLARSSALLASLVAALTLTACGGGGGGGGSAGGSGGTGATTSSFSQGAITGFGSIIVNGVRHDDSSASVTDDDDDDNPTRSKDDLKLGMVVSVSGTSGTDTGTASAIAFGSELKGPVQTITGTVSSGTRTLIILGQTVIVGTRTVFDPVSLPGGFADIKKDDVLEVHGHLDPAANKLTATRINRENNANKYKITGNVSSLSAVSKSFKIGSETINYGSIEPGKLRVNLANGITVKVRLDTTPIATGTWTAIRIKPAKKALEDKAKAEIEGVIDIDAFTSATKFSINGIPVDASNASFPKGTASIVPGARVEAKGRLVNGTLVATQVKAEDDEDNEIELHGLISSINTASKTFELRGLTVSYAGNVDYQRGSVTDLKKDANVEVKGVAATGGTTVQAIKIKFEN